MRSLADPGPATGCLSLAAWSPEALRSWRILGPRAVRQPGHSGAARRLGQDPWPQPCSAVVPPPVASSWIQFLAIPMWELGEFTVKAVANV